jgi:anti-anti-sigma factor
MGKILVIDDERATLGMFKLFLGAYGFSVLTAENGAEGLALFEKERPSIVITDIKMPGMDGLEVLKRIKALDPATEVIVITGHGDIDLAVEALNFNAADFINKPIQKSALDSALKRAQERLNAWDRPGNEVILRTVEDISIMAVDGNVTSESEAFLQGAYDEAIEKGASKIVLLFNENSTVNGDGIAVLLRLLSKTKRRDQRVAISGLSENFKKIFDMVGITKYAKIFDSEDEAIRSFSKRGDNEPGLT